MNPRSAAPKRISIRKLLEEHDRHRAKSALRASLGDGYLYLNNPVFRHVRDSALKTGVRFTPDDRIHYRAWPLVAILEIYRSKTIPYLDNVAALKKLEQTRPGFFDISHLKVLAPNPNYLMHEAAHCVAAGIWDKHRPRVRKQEVVKYLLLEAFANSADALCNLHCTDDLSRMFIKMNSYWYFELEARLVLRRLANRFGARALSVITLLMMFCANLRYVDLGPSALARILRIAGIPPRAVDQQAQEDLRQLVKNLLQLEKGFVVGTTQLFFQLLGYDEEIESLTNFSPFKLIESSASLRSCVQEMAATLSGQSE